MPRAHGGLAPELIWITHYWIFFFSLSVFSALMQSNPPVAGSFLLLWTALGCSIPPLATGGRQSPAVEQKLTSNKPFKNNSTNRGPKIHPVETLIERQKQLEDDPQVHFVIYWNSHTADLAHSWFVSIELPPACLSFVKTPSSSVFSFKFILTVQLMKRRWPDNILNHNWYKSQLCCEDIKSHHWPFGLLSNK